MKYIIFILVLLVLITPVAANRTIATTNISLLDDSAYDSLIAAIGGNESLNSTNDEIDFMEILSVSKSPYTDAIGNIFYVMVFGILFIMLYIRQGSVAIPSVLGLILGGFILSFMPEQYYLVGISFVAISIVGIFFGVLKER